MKELNEVKINDAGVSSSTMNGGGSVVLGDGGYYVCNEYLTTILDPWTQRPISYTYIVCDWYQNSPYDEYGNLISDKPIYVYDYGYWYNGMYGEIPFKTHWDESYGVYYDHNTGTYATPRAVDKSLPIAENDPWFTPSAEKYENTRRGFWENIDVIRGILIYKIFGNNTDVRRALTCIPRGRYAAKVLGILKIRNHNPDEAVEIINNYVYGKGGIRLGYMPDSAYDQYGLYILKK